MANHFPHLPMQDACRYVVVIGNRFQEFRLKLIVVFISRGNSETFL
jgi:hypothetical protein